MPNSAPIGDLEVRGLSKRMPGFTLSADFRVPQGQTAALLGPSGSGKTTLLRLIAGLERPDAGQVFAGKEEIGKLEARRREVGFVFQDQALFPHLSVIENAAFGLKMRGSPLARREELAARWLERFGLGSRARSPVTELSGGEAQRVALIRAWIWRPRLLLLDEPFSGLDAALRSELTEALLELHREWPVPMILVSHDDRDWRRLANHQLEIRLEEGGKSRTVALTGC